MDTPAAAAAGKPPQAVEVPFRIVPSIAPWRRVTASLIPTSQVPLFRRLVYALPRETISAMRIALTSRGAVLRCEAGVESVPLGEFYYEFHPGLYIPAGFDVSPAIAPEVLYRAMGAVSGASMFIDPLTRAFSIDDVSFAPLENLLLESVPWEPIVSEAIQLALAEEPIDLKIEPLAMFSTRNLAGKDAAKRDDSESALAAPIPKPEAE
jgi:hypothetical protein